VLNAALLVCEVWTDDDEEAVSCDLDFDALTKREGRASEGVVAVVD